MRGFKRWFTLLGLPLLAALFTTLLDSGAIRLLQEPLLKEQQQRMAALERDLASRDLTLLDEVFISSMRSESLQAQQELELWQRDHALLLTLDRIQLLPSIAFWVVYFFILGRLKKREQSA